MKNLINLIYYIIFSKNIIVIRSPLQLINFYEFENIKKSLVNSKYPILFVFLNNHEFKQAINTKNFLKFKRKIIFISSRQIKFLIFLKNIKRFIAGKYKICISGNMHNDQFQKGFLKNSERQFVLDDGGSTLIIKKKSFRNYKDLKLFTIYKNNNLPKKYIIENNYDYLKKKIKKKGFKYNNDVHLVSSKIHSYLKGQSKIEYFNKIRKLKKLYPKKKIYYISHRKENLKDLPKNLNLKIIKLSVPLEVYYLKIKILPYLVITNYSSAAFVLSKVLRSNLRIVNFSSDLKLLTSRKKELISNFLIYRKIYKQFNIAQIRI